MRSPTLAWICLTAGLAAAGCGDDDTWPGADVPRDAGADAPADSPTDSPADMPAEADAEGGADAEADGTTGDAAGRHGPDLLYDGARDDRAVVPGWDPDRPRPLIVFSKYDAEDVWHVSMAEVSETGVVGGMVTERVRFWGWGDFSAYAPSLLYEGPLTGGRVPGWDAASPLPVIALTRYAASRTWFVSMMQIDATGALSGPVTDEARIWGWPSDDPASGAPGLLYDGPRDGGAIAPGWSVADPPPLIVLTRNAAETTWWLSMAEVSASGVVGGMITDWIRFWGW